MHATASNFYHGRASAVRRVEGTRGRAIAEPLADPFNLILSGCVSFLILCIFVAAYTEPLDWFLLPIFLCGCLSGIDMMAYLRGQLDTFDPLGTLGVFAYYFFFLSPLLMLFSGYHSKFLPAVPDWTDWIGWMA